MRIQAVFGLVEISPGNAEGASAALEVLTNPSDHYTVRSIAAWSLGEFKFQPDGVISALKAALPKSDEYDQLGECAAAALKKIQGEER